MESFLIYLHCSEILQNYFGFQSNNLTSWAHNVDKNVLIKSLETKTFWDFLNWMHLFKHDLNYAQHIADVVL